MRPHSRSFFFLYFLLLTPVHAIAQICPTCTSVAVGDLNGDGKPDAVIPIANQNTVGVFINDGNGNLTAKQFLPVSGRPTSVVLADFNLDGHLDILVAEHLNPFFEIFPGDGTGNFGPAIKVPVGLGSLGVGFSGPVIADFNGDGIPDIAFPSGIQFATGAVNLGVGIFFGDGHFGFSGQHLSLLSLVGASITQLFVADINKDGKPDLVANFITTHDAQGSLVALNRGGGVFTSSLLDFNSPVTSVADFNGDGNLDFNLQSGAILFGDGAGGILFRQPFEPSTGIAVDFDHNGTIDLVAAANQYFPGNGHGGFGDLITFSPPPPTGGLIGIADLNGDGLPDVIVQDANGNVSVTLNNVAAPVSIQASTTSELHTSAVTATAGVPVTLLATVGSEGGTVGVFNQGGGVPAGSVTFLDGATTLGSAPVNQYGIAAIDVPFTAGVHNLTANFTGTLDPVTNTVFGPGSNANGPITLFVNPTPPTGAAPTVMLTAAPNPDFQDNPVTLTATVSSPAGTPTGNLVFRADGQVLGFRTLLASPESQTVSFPAPALHNVEVTYGGDAAFLPATSATLVEDIRAFNAPRNPSSVQIALSTSTLPGPGPNQAATITASLAGVPKPPSDFVIRVNGAFLSFQGPDGPLVPVTFKPEANGTYSISAEYAGDAALAPGTSTATLVVGNSGGDFSLSASPTVATVKAGQPATFTINMVPLNGFGASVTFSCSGLPTGAACSFSPATVTPNGTVALVTLTVNTTAAQALSVPLRGLQSGASGWSLAGLAFGIVLLGGFRSKTTAAQAFRRSALFGLLLLLLSCGGSGGGPTPGPSPSPTPAGTPSGQFIVTASSSTITHSTPLTLTVN